MQTTTASPADFLNTDYVSARKLLLPSYESLSITLIGCGGTGSWLAPAAVRVARLLRERFNKSVSLYFVDPDSVEEKNVYRQNFCQAEIGRNKAETLAFRYGGAWGVEITAIPAPFTDDYTHHTGGNQTILIGCVDRASARKAIYGRAKYRGSWWLDCGNFKNAGQVLLGGPDEDRKRKPFTLPGFCGWLPYPAVQHPELISAVSLDSPGDGLTTAIAADQPVCLSCAEMALQDAQGLAINQRIAAEAADYLIRMLITKDLVKYATYIDLESGVTRSKYITPDNLAAASSEQ